VTLSKFARAQSVNRVLVGAGLVLFPHRFARTWVGPWAADDRAKVLARSMGVRDFALGAAALVAERDGHVEWARRAFAAQALADAVDLIAIETAGRSVPLSSRLFGGAMAAGSAAVAALYAQQLASRNAPL
jgi:hypothetical protein